LVGAVDPKVWEFGYFEIFRSVRYMLKSGLEHKRRKFVTMVYYPGFTVGDQVVVCYGYHCGFQGRVTRVLDCFLWVQGANDYVVNVRKHSVALIVEGASDTESDITVGQMRPNGVPGPMSPNVVPDYDSDVTE
jgi:hypothetical protein